jgi:preprotein translocase subunit SecD
VTSALGSRVVLVGMVTLCAGLSACGGSSGDTVARLVPTSAATSTQLDADARVVTSRLHALGDVDVVVSVDDHQLVVTSTRPLRTSTSVLTAPGHVYFRPVLCGAPDPAADAVPLPAPTPPCGAQYLTNMTNLDVVTGSNAPAGYTATTIAADPAFSEFQPTTPAADDPKAAVLLSRDPAGGQQQYPRFVLGPAELTDAAIASARATFDTTINAWALPYTMTPAGSVQWDEFTHRYFHQYIAIDIDGTVLSAPIIQPASATFSSFQGKGEISGDFTRSAARDLAAILGSGHLAVALRVAS